MSIDEPYLELDDILNQMGVAGERLSEISASEGAAGNISVYIGWPVEVRRRFPNVETMQLPDRVPALAGKTFIVSGSGRRLREIVQDPAANLAAVIVSADGASAKLCTSPRRLFARVTSEFNSHLAVHCDQVLRTSTNYLALIHAQPMHLTYLSHIARYRDAVFMNQHLLRWQPELIVNFPEGVGVLPFLLPGSSELMQANVEGLREHQVVVWSKHGLMARSDLSVKRACDRIEYLETAARYELMNLSNGEIADGLSAEEIKRIAVAFNVKQSIF